MVNQNRQCFFIIESHHKNYVVDEKSLPWKNTRNYMNKMTISEDDNFEICGLFAIPNGRLTKEQKEEKTNIPGRIIRKLSGSSGIVDVLVSGLNLCKRFRIYEGPLGMD